MRVVIVLALVSVGGLGVAVWRLPPALYPASAPEARAALQGALTTAAAALLAVAGGLIALSETRRANENTHVRELYIEAVKLLSDPDSSIRLGGLYALERIAVDSPADQRTVVEVLSAFVRERSTDPVLRPTPPADGAGTPPSRPAADIRAAVQVLARLPRRPGVPRCDLHGADLTGPACLAELDLAEANLRESSLEGADLARAQMERADLTLAWMKGVDLSGAWLRDANLSRASMEAADLSGIFLKHANLTDAWMRGANLTHSELNLANLTDARVDRADLSGADVRGAKFSRALLTGANLTGVLGLTQTQIDQAIGDEATVLPDGLVRPASWRGTPDPT